MPVTTGPAVAQVPHHKALKYSPITVRSAATALPTAAPIRTRARKDVEKRVVLDPTMLRIPIAPCGDRTRYVAGVAGCPTSFDPPAAPGHLTATIANSSKYRNRHIVIENGSHRQSIVSNQLHSSAPILLRCIANPLLDTGFRDPLRGTTSVLPGSRFRCVFGCRFISGRRPFHEARFRSVPVPCSLDESQNPSDHSEQPDQHEHQRRQTGHDLQYRHC